MRYLLLLAVSTLSAFVLAVPPTEQQTASPVLDAEEAAKRATVPPGHTVRLWAAEPLLANPVSFSFDPAGRCFVAETYRHSDGVTDIRGHMDWLDDDLASRTVADRVALFEKHKYRNHEKYAEQLRIVWDSTGQGVADKSDVFAGGFNKPADGLAAGVLARRDKVFFTCIPDVYAFGSDPKQSKATSRKSLATGFGVHVQFIGHDLHGLILGPDGRLYFTCADRGLNVVTKEGKTLANPDSGCVLRCEQDGSHLEIIHCGLRNPQELAFDNYGNLFTYDNNSDSGDAARWVYVVEGGDSGWRCGYQYGTQMHTPAVPQGNRGPWNTEKLWHTQFEGQAAYVLPSLKHFGNGPSGIAHYPGVGLNAKYADHFFAVDFTSTPSSSKIWSLALKPKGAAFEVVDLEPFVQNMVATDVEFGPDGALYWLDWTGGWDKPGKGRIFQVTDAEAMKNPAVAEAKTLIAEGMKLKSIDELIPLLGHAHQKVRFEAQYELAHRNNIGAVQGLSTNPSQSIRRHALWCLSQIERAKPESKITYDTFATDSEPSIRSQAVKATRSATVILRLLRDPDPQVRFQAAISYGKFTKPIGSESYHPLFDLLKTNNDADPYLRHAAVQGLVSMTEQSCDLVTALDAAKQYDTPAVRLGVVLALRKLQCVRLARFLTDTDPRIVAEAARAIYDTELMATMDDVAKLAETPNLPEAVAFRALAANFKLGEAEHANRLAAYAARSTEPDLLRSFALKLLAEWPAPPRRDAITGLTQSLPARPAEVARAALRPSLDKLFTGRTTVRTEVVACASKLGLPEVGKHLLAMVCDVTEPTAGRVDSLYALQKLKADELEMATATAVSSSEAKLRAAARTVDALVKGPAAAAELVAVLKDAAASREEKQAIFAAFATMAESKAVDASLAEWLDLLATDKVPAELQLDLLDAATARTKATKLTLHAPLKEKLAAHTGQVNKAANGNIALRYTETLQGGDAERGRAIFLNSAAVSCQKCHKLAGQGGEVGPVLDGIGTAKTREYLLESIVNPNAQIAQGYQSVILTLTDGKTVSGVLRYNDKKVYVLVTPENKVLTIPVHDVDADKPDKSAMPDDLHQKLSRRELRDLVEFLSGLKATGK